MSRRLKVVYVLPPVAKNGGWRTHARGLVGAMLPRVDLVLLVAQDDRSAAEKLFPGVRKLHLPAIQDFGPFPAAVPKVVGTIYHMLRTRPGLRADLVHSLAAYPTGLVGHAVSRLLGRPHVLTAHGTYAVLPAAHPIHRRLYELVLRGAETICPVSAETGRLIAEQFPAVDLSAKLEPIVNGNEAHLKTPRAIALERRRSDTPLMLTVGAFKSRKGQDVSLRAYQEVKRRIPSLRYRLIGAADNRRYLDGLLRLIEKGKLKDVEIITNATDSQVEASYREASLFVLTPRQVGYRFEGFGLVYLEAGAYGLPVIGSRSGGVPSAIRPDETGFIVPPDDIHATADAIESLVSEWELNRRMGWANRQWCERLTWERTADEQMGVYSKIVAVSRAPSSPDELTAVMARNGGDG